MQQVLSVARFQWNRAIFFAALLFVPVLGITQPVATVPCPVVHQAKDFAAAWTAAVIGPGNRDHTCLRQLLTKDALITGAAINDDGKTGRIVETTDQFIDWYEKRGTETFWERSLRSTLVVYNNVARMIRIYEVRGTANGPVTARGIEDFQLVFDGLEWRAFTILWQDEIPGKPLPHRLLAK